MCNEICVSCGCHIQWYKMAQNQTMNVSGNLLWLQNQQSGSTRFGGFWFQQNNAKVVAARTQGGIFLYIQVWIITNVIPLCTVWMCP